MTPGIAAAGKQLDRSTVSYSLPGDKINNVMGVFSALGTIAFTFGDTLLPEIQVRRRACMHSRSTACQPLTPSAFAYNELCPDSKHDDLWESMLLEGADGPEMKWR